MERRPRILHLLQVAALQYILSEELMNEAIPSQELGSGSHCVNWSLIWTQRSSGSILLNTGRDGFLFGSQEPFPKRSGKK